MQKPTHKEIDDAFKEEYEAAVAFAKALEEETRVKIVVERARHRLMLARSLKAQMFNDLLEGTLIAPLDK